MIPEEFAPTDQRIYESPETVRSPGFFREAADNQRFASEAQSHGENRELHRVWCFSHSRSADEPISHLGELAVHFPSVSLW